VSRIAAPDDDVVDDDAVDGRRRRATATGADASTPEPAGRTPSSSSSVDVGGETSIPSAGDLENPIPDDGEDDEDDVVAALMEEKKSSLANTDGRLFDDRYAAAQTARPSPPSSPLGAGGPESKNLPAASNSSAGHTQRNRSDGTIPNGDDGDGDDGDEKAIPRL